MKFLPAFLALSLFCSTGFSAALHTADGFLAVLRAAYNSKNLDDISTLTWWNGASKEDRERQEQAWTMLFRDDPVVSNVSFKPAGPEFNKPRVESGKRVEVTYPPAGIVSLEFDAGQSGSHQRLMLPYAVINGAYYLVAAKTTDLGWKGPKDKVLSLRVTGSGADKVKIHVEYNASGVPQEDDPATPHNYAGQYFSEVAVTSDDPNANVTLELGEGENAVTYKSQPLIGKGGIVYRRPPKPAASGSPAPAPSPGG